MTPQLILFLDRSGTLRAEVAGRSGTRRKLDLPQGRANRRQQMETLLAELQAQQVQIDLEDARLAASRQVKRIDPEIARQEKARQARLEHDRQWQQWLDNLPADQRAYQLAKRDEALARRDSLEADRAQAVRQMFPPNPVKVRRFPDSTRGDGLRSSSSASSLGL